MPERFCLLSVHAHPDDESSSAGTVARYHAEGVHTVLVTCTGEEGDILNPSLDRDDVRNNLGAIRQGELEAAAEIIGYDEVIMLGYRDSGMPDTPSNADPRSFAQAPLDEAVGKLVEIIRRFRSQVIITYGEDERRYRHPDHLRVHEVSLIAFDQAGDPDAFVGRGEPFTPSKLYYSRWPREKTIERHHKFVELGMESPYEAWRDRGFFDEVPPDDTPVTEIDLTGFEHVRFDSLRAHATQIDPDSPYWFGLPTDIDHAIYSSDGFTLAQNRVGPIGPETDLFAGLREDVRIS